MLLHEESEEVVFPNHHCVVRALAMSEPKKVTEMHSDQLTLTS